MWEGRVWVCSFAGRGMWWEGFVGRHEHAPVVFTTLLVQPHVYCFGGCCHGCVRVLGQGPGSCTPPTIRVRGISQHYCLGKTYVTLQYMGKIPSLPSRRWGGCGGWRGSGKTTAVVVLCSGFAALALVGFLCWPLQVLLSACTTSPFGLSELCLHRSQCLLHITYMCAHADCVVIDGW